MCAKWRPAETPRMWDARAPAGLLGIQAFSAEAFGWGDEISYPGMPDPFDAGRGVPLNLGHHS